MNRRCKFRVFNDYFIIIYEIETVWKIRRFRKFLVEIGEHYVGMFLKVFLTIYFIISGLGLCRDMIIENRSRFGQFGHTEMF